MESLDPNNKMQLEVEQTSENPLREYNPITKEEVLQAMEIGMSEWSKIKGKNINTVSKALQQFSIIIPAEFAPEFAGKQTPED